MEGTVLILGANSSIARFTAMALAAKGFSLYLTGRDQEDIQRIAMDIHIRYNVTVHHGYFDAEDFASHASFFQSVLAKTEKLAGVIQAFGYMGNSQAADQNKEDIKIINSNFTGAVSIINLCAEHLAAQRAGFIVGISSVAGDRGRKTNCIYGAAKAGLSHYLQGLRNRLFSQNVRVITIKPGYVDTAMTFGNPKMFLVASPEKIGKQIANAINKNKDILYLPWFWRYIMLIVKYIPEKIFKRLSL